MEPDEYNWDGLRGWRKYRALRPGRGMWHDVRRRLPYYWNDITDAFTYRTVAATVRMYFVNLLPALAYILDMYRQTGQFYGVNEALLSSALAAVVFSLLGAQTLTIVGITGLISLFNYTIYDIIERYDVTVYPQFMAWVGIWAAIFHWIAALANSCDYMRYATDFSSEAFGMYVGIIYIIKGVEELVDEFTRDTTDGYLSCLIAILYFGTIYALERIGNSVMFGVRFRTLLADYAFPIGTIFWVGFAHIPGTLKSTNLTKLPVTRAFHPTQPRDWLIRFWSLNIGWIFVAIPFGFLVMLLFYYDHNVSSLTAQARQYPLKKPGGFHWDFFLLGCTTFLSAIIGLPYPNGLVPQAPVHTDACANFETKLKIIQTDEGEGTEIRRPVTVVERVFEQRVTHFLMALALIGTMTGPLLTVLGTMPRAVFAGVFFVVGWGSIESNGITTKIIFLLRERRFIDLQEPLQRANRWHIAHYLFWQLLGVFTSVAISQTIAAIGFPVLICALIPLRWLILPKLFSRADLEIMDDLTANNRAVLASLGGRPEMPAMRQEEVSDGRVRRGDANGLNGAAIADEPNATTGSRLELTKRGSDREWRTPRRGTKRQRGGSFQV